MKDILIIISIFIGIILLAYPVTKLIGKAWFKSYFDEITNIKEKKK